MNEPLICAWPLKLRALIDRGRLDDAVEDDREPSPWLSCGVLVEEPRTGLLELEVDGEQAVGVACPARAAGDLDAGEERLDRRSMPSGSGSPSATCWSNSGRHGHELEDAGRADEARSSSSSSAPGSSTETRSWPWVTTIGSATP